MAARPGVLLHDAVVLGRVVEAERLDDRADLLVGVEELVAVGVVGGEPGGELAAVLQVEQHPRHQPRELVRVAGPDGRAVAAARQVVDRRDAAFVVQLVHVTAGLKESELSPVYWHYRTSRGGVQEWAAQPRGTLSRFA